MSQGCPLHVCFLKVGDVVRSIKGPLTPQPMLPGLYYTLSDGKSVRKVEATKGWREPEIGGPHDYRAAYDTMTVYQADDNYVSFLRPYLHLNENGTISCVGVESVDMVPRASGGHWYELLSHRSTK